MLYAQKVKDPLAVLDYEFAWGREHGGEPPWLQPGEFVQTETITISPAGLTLESSDITAGGQSVTVWLSQGTTGTTYTVRCKVVTTESRTDVRSMSVLVQNR
ncbi:phage fiber-tail adaptor protein [Nocardia tengchongensis]